MYVFPQEIISDSWSAELLLAGQSSFYAISEEKPAVSNSIILDNTTDNPSASLLDSGVSALLSSRFFSSWMGFFFGEDPVDDFTIHRNPPFVDVEDQERQFHDAVREHIICLLLFISLYLFSYWILSKFKMRNEFDSLFSGDEDYFVYRISTWMCTVSMAVSVGSIILMPFSVLGAELLQRYSDNYYLQWLSWSLIHSLWNYVFILGNLSLFVLLPFSYFFLESQGFSKKKNGLLGRLYETVAVCALLIVVLLCLCDVIYNLLVASSPNLSILNLFSIFSITSVNLPLIYSCVSLFGVLLLLVSTPVGFSRMFTILAEKAQVPIPDDDDQQVIERLELCCKRRRESRKEKESADTETLRRLTRTSYSSSVPAPYLRYSPQKNANGFTASKAMDYSGGDINWNTYSRTPLSYGNYGGFVSDIVYPDTSSSSMDPLIPSSSSSSRQLLLGEKSLRWYQRLLNVIKYPFCVICLVFLTSIAVLMVVINTLKLFFGYRALPVYVQYMEVQTRHSFGLLGVFVEMAIMLYVMATSLVGFYSMPFLHSIRPQREKTSMTAIIINCSSLAILSSALPVLAATLGITSFDLLGAYGSLQWLSNFQLVIAYNVAFAGVTIAILAKQLTSHFVRELARRLFCRTDCVDDDDKLLMKME